MQQNPPSTDRSRRFEEWQDRHPGLNFSLVILAPLALLGALYLGIRLVLWVLGVPS